MSNPQQHTNNNSMPGRQVPSMANAFIIPIEDSPNTSPHHAIQISPNTFISPRYLNPLSHSHWAFCLLLWDPVSNSFSPIAHSLQGLHMRPADIPSKLHINISTNSLYRLFHAGFISGRRITPDTIEISLHSLANHLAACTDPHFWSPTNLDRFRNALF